MRAITRLGLTPAVVASLGIAFAIEFAQLVNLLDMLGLRDNRIVAVVFGGSFDMMDLVVYTIGVFLVIVVETILKRRSLKP